MCGAIRGPSVQDRRSILGHARNWDALRLHRLSSTPLVLEVLPGAGPDTQACPRVKCGYSEAC